VTERDLERELREWVKEHLEKGFSPEQLEAALVKAGHSETSAKRFVEEYKSKRPSRAAAGRKVEMPKAKYWWAMLASGILAFFVIIGTFVIQLPLLLLAFPLSFILIFSLLAPLGFGVFFIVYGFERKKYDIFVNGIVGAGAAVAALIFSQTSTFSAFFGPPLHFTISTLTTHVAAGLGIWWLARDYGVHARWLWQAGVFIVVGRVLIEILTGRLTSIGGYVSLIGWVFAGYYLIKIWTMRKLTYSEVLSQSLRERLIKTAEEHMRLGASSDEIAESLQAHGFTRDGMRSVLGAAEKLVGPPNPPMRFLMRVAAIFLVYGALAGVAPIIFIEPFGDPVIILAASGFGNIILGLLLFTYGRENKSKGLKFSGVVLTIVAALTLVTTQLFIQIFGFFKYALLLLSNYTLFFAITVPVILIFSYGIYKLGETLQIKKLKRAGIFFAFSLALILFSQPQVTISLIRYLVEISPLLLIPLFGAIITASLLGIIGIIRLVGHLIRGPAPHTRFTEVVKRPVLIGAIVAVIIVSLMFAVVAPMVRAGI